jgi:hypothetical protein
LRDPGIPSDPELVQAITFPSVSLNVMIVLSYVACTGTTPEGTVFFYFFLKDFFFVAFAGAFAICRDLR